MNFPTRKLPVTRIWYEMMNNEPMVSVIVLTYNHEAYIRQTLDGILMQKTEFTYEILIGDDVSSDCTRDILAEYAAAYPDRIRLFLREKNLGATRNAYELLMAARGNYLAFCEGDDYWTNPEKLAIQVRFLETHPEYIGCSHRCEIVDENGFRRADQKLSWVRERKCFTLRDFRGKYLPGQTATIVKRNIFRDSTESYSFLYEASKDISDRTATLLYLSRGPFACLSETMSAYRRTEDKGITNGLFKDNPDRIRNELIYTEKLEQLAAELTSQNDIFDDYYAFLYAWAVWRRLKHSAAETKRDLRETAAHIGAGLIHPVAIVRGVLQILGIR